MINCEVNWESQLDGLIFGTVNDCSLESITLDDFLNSLDTVDGDSSRLDCILKKEVIEF
jgi:hypothetical protein